METIGLGVLMFTSVILALVAVLTVAKNKLVASARRSRPVTAAGCRAVRLVARLLAARLSPCRLDWRQYRPDGGVHGVRRCCLDLNGHCCNCMAGH